MKIDRPFVQLRELFRAANQENRELLKYVFEKSDSISLWVIGLAVGGISIFANNIADVQGAISPAYLKPILLLLTTSVTSGIVYRGMYLYFFVVLNKTIQGIDIVLSNHRMMATESNLKGNEIFDQLVKELDIGFGDDLSYLIPLYHKIEEHNKKELYDSVVKHYHAKIKFAQRDTELLFDFVADTYSKFQGINKDKLLSKMKNPQSSGRQYRRTIRWTTFFILCIFLHSFLLFSLLYLR